VDAERENLLTLEMEQLAKHPKVDKVVKVVPNDCLKCHKEGTKSGSLSDLTHKNHFGNPAENYFVTTYKGDCLNCHTLDMNTFKMGIKSGPANW
jgi:nitrate reductase cytochrome c-type subunit